MGRQEEEELRKKVKIGLLGLGTVGSGVYRILTEGNTILTQKAGMDLEVDRILVRNLDRKRRVDVESDLLTTDPEMILNNPDISIVVEVLGGEEPARTYIEKALRAGKQVVTANKEVIAKHGVELLKMAREEGVDLFFEASVAGGIPILRPLQESLAGEDVEAVYGIVNGTTNYMLTAMDKQGLDFAEVLADAQERGYAEADPTADIAGHDAARKLAILASIAFNTRVPLDKVYCTGIEKITAADIAGAAELGYVIKLLAIARRVKGGIEARVHPALVPQEHPLAAVDGVYNAVVVQGWAVGTLMFYGAGAGQMPTGSAVVGDVIAAAKNIASGVQGKARVGFAPGAPVVPLEEVETRYYLRLRVVPEPGVLGVVTHLCSREGVELVSLDIKNWGQDSANLIIRTQLVREGAFQRVLKTLKEEPRIYAVESYIRIEGEE
ncbi:MAG: homoserine dehydrogenase [Firmicutes bacterium]|nr:homoserine dehydrogenase [Bacillota bacterium]